MFCQSMPNNVKQNPAWARIPSCDFNLNKSKAIMFNVAHRVAQTREWGEGGRNTHRGREKD